MTASPAEVQATPATHLGGWAIARVAEDRVAMASLVLLGILAAGIRFNDQLVGLTGDNAAYILLGRDLLTGRPYDNAGYPWGYPALLTPFIAAIGPDNLIAAIPWLKLLTIAFYVASLPVIYALFRTRQRPTLAFVAAMLFAVNSATLLYANDVMTELPFTFFSFAALLYWQKVVAPWAEEKGLGNVPWRRLAVAGLLLVVPYYIRTVGLALLVAPVMVLLFNRRWRATAVMGAALILGALPWLIASRTASANNYASQLLLRDPYNPALGSISSLWEMVGRIWSGLWLYVTQVFPLMVLPAPTPSVLQAVVGPLMAALMLVGLVLYLVRRLALPEVYLVLFVLILAIWPWKADRFLLPVYPLLLHYTLEGGDWVVGMAGKLARRRWTMDDGRWTTPRLLSIVHRPSSIVMVVVALTVALPNLYWAGVAGAENLRYLRGQGPAGGHTPDWQEYFAACRWLKENTPPGSVIMSRKTTLTELYADRPSVQIPLVRPPDYPAYIRDNNVTYILEDGFTWSIHTTQYLRPALVDLPERFKLLTMLGPPKTRIWEVVGAK